MGATGVGAGGATRARFDGRLQVQFAASLLVCLLAVGLCVASVASATIAPPSPVPESSWVANGQVTDAAWSGHTLYIGGTFSRIGPPTGPFAVLSGATGVQQGSWPVVAGGDAAVEAIISDGSGGWYVGGNFTSVGGTSIRNLAHIASSGTLDTAFEPNPDNTVRALVLAPGGGTLYVTGDFTQIGGEDREELAAVDTSNGAALPALAPGFGGFEFVQNRHGMALALSPATNILYAADYPAGFYANPEIKAFDTATGHLDSAFTVKAQNLVNALAVSPDGQTLYIAGPSSIDGQARNGLGAVNATSGAVTSFNPPGNTSYPAEHLELTNDGATLYAGGLNGLQEISTVSGAVSSSFKPAIGEVVALALSPDQAKLYVSGATLVAGQKEPTVKELNATTGAAESSFSTQPNGAPSVVAVSSTGTVAIGGGGREIAIEVEPFTSLGGVERNGFAAIDETTGQPTSLRLDFSSRFVVSPDGGSLYAIAGGAHPGNTKLIRVATSTGAISSTFTVELAGYTTALAVSPDGGTLYVGGIFTAINGHPASDLAALNTSDGSMKTSFTASAKGESGGVNFGYTGSSTVDTLAVSPDGTTLYVGGDFTEIDGQPIAHLAAVHTTDGSLDSAFAPNLPSNRTTSQTILATAVNQAGSLLYAGGVSFGLRAYDTGTGSPSATFSPSLNDEVPALALSPDGSTLYVGGFNKLQGAFNAVTGEVVPSFNPAVPRNTSIDTLAFAPDGALAAAGELRNVDQTPLGQFAIFPPSGGPPVNAALPDMGAGDAERDFLYATGGVWAGAQPISLHYQWLRDGVAIPGATSNTHYFQGETFGHRLNVEVTATNSLGQASATSFPYWNVGFPSAPINTEPPQINGTAVAGNTLTASEGSWSGTAPLTYGYQWLRDGVAIPGATSTAYVVSNTDAGHELAVRVIATNSVGESSATSAGVKVPVPLSSNPSGGGSGSSFGGGTTTSGGNGQTGQSEPSPAVIQAALASALQPKGGLPTISSLLKAGGYNLSFNAPGAGILSIQWTTTTAQASKHKNRKAKPVVVASGSGAFSSSGRGTIKVRLTATGRKLLKRSKTLVIVEAATFKPSSGSTQTKRATITIRAGQRTRHR